MTFPIRLPRVDSHVQRAALEIITNYTIAIALREKETDMSIRRSPTKNVELELSTIAAKHLQHTDSHIVIIRKRYRAL